MYSSDVIRPYSLSEAVFILSAKRSILFVPFIGREAELIVPVLSETADKRLTEELIERQVQFMPQLPRAVADIPAMILQSRQIPHPGQAYGIQMAGDGFLKDVRTLRCWTALLLDRFAAG